MRRISRNATVKALSVIVPLRSYRCSICSCGQLRLHRPAGWQWPLWALMAAIAASPFLRDPAEVSAAEIVAPATPSLATPASTGAGIPVESVVATAARTEPAEAVQAAEAVDSTPPTDVAGSQPGIARRLERIDVRFIGGKMRIDLGLGQSIDAPTIVRQDNPVGYFIDLPGSWELPTALRCRRSFTRSPLKELRCDRNDERLRMTFTVRNPKSDRVRLAKTSDGLLVTVY